MWHFSADMFGHPTGLFQRPFLMAGGTETPPPAGERHEKFLTALRAAHPGKAVLEVAAFQELVHDRLDDRPPKAIACLVTLLVSGFELRVGCS